MPEHYADLRYRQRYEPSPEVIYQAAEAPYARASPA